MAVFRGFAPVTGSERQPAAGATRVADADPDESLSVTIRVRRRPDGPPMPSLGDLAKIPLDEREFPSREEFARLYGAADDDLAAVAAFAQAHGLTVTGQSAGPRTVMVSGTVAQMNAAFGVNLGRYESPEGTYRGREGPIYLPSELGAIVESVLGLDNRPVVRPGLTDRAEGLFGLPRHVGVGRAEAKPSHRAWGGQDRMGRVTPVPSVLLLNVFVVLLPARVWAAGRRR